MHPNSIEIVYHDYRYAFPAFTEKRQPFEARTPEGRFEFIGTYTEAREFFRQKFPSKAIVFRQEF